MTHSMTFSVDDLALATKDAAKIAPNKGRAFDIAQGIVLEPVMVLSGAKDQVSVQATDLDIEFREVISAELEWPTERSIRLPDRILSSLVSQMNGGTVTLTLGEQTCLVESGSLKAELNTIDTASWPRVFPHDEEGKLVTNFSEVIHQVEWAAARRGTIPFAGIHFDGTGVVATDKAKLAEVALEFDVGPKPITVPMDSITSIIRRGSDVNIYATGTMLYLRSTDTGRNIELGSRIYAADYPKMDTVRQYFEVTKTIEVDKNELNEKVNRMMVLAQGERYPLMTVNLLATGEMHMAMAVTGYGEVEDHVGYGSTEPHDFSFQFTPTTIQAVCRAVKGPVLAIGHHEDPRRPITFADPDDKTFRCLSMPRA